MSVEREREESAKVSVNNGQYKRLDQNILKTFTRLLNGELNHELKLYVQTYMASGIFSSSAISFIQPHLKIGCNIPDYRRYVLVSTWVIHIMVIVRK